MTLVLVETIRGRDARDRNTTRKTGEKKSVSGQYKYSSPVWVCDQCSSLNRTVDTHHRLRQKSKHSLDFCTRFVININRHPSHFQKPSYYIYTSNHVESLVFDDRRGAGRTLLPAGTSEWNDTYSVDRLTIDSYFTEISFIVYDWLTPVRSLFFLGTHHGQPLWGQARRSQPIGVRGLRQLVAKHYRHHQPHRRTRRRATRKADRPVHVHPVQWVHK